LIIFVIELLQMRGAELEQVGDKQAAAAIQEMTDLDLLGWRAFLKPQLLAYVLRTRENFDFSENSTLKNVASNPTLGAMFRDLACFSGQDTPGYINRGEDLDTEDITPSGKLGRDWAGLFMAKKDRPLQELILTMAYLKPGVALTAKKLLFAAYGEGDHTEEGRQFTLLAEHTLLIATKKFGGKKAPQFALDETVRAALVVKLLEDRVPQDEIILDEVTISRLDNKHVNWRFRSDLAT
jgi:hypothetical protein